MANFALPPTCVSFCWLINCCLTSKLPHAKDDIMDRVGLFLSCNGPSSTTASNLLHFKSCCKLSCTSSIPQMTGIIKCVSSVVRYTRCKMIWFMVFNAIFNNISAISWGSVFMIENHRPVASHWQTLSHNVVSIRCKSIGVSVRRGQFVDCPGYSCSLSPSHQKEKMAKTILIKYHWKWR